MDLDDFLNKILFVKKKKRKRIVDEDFEEEVKETKKAKKVEEDIDWDEETEAKVEELPDTFQEERKQRLKIPKGKALININRKSWLHIIMGGLLVIVNLILLFVGSVGWLQLWEEKIMVTMYAIPSIYVTMNYTWMKIQGTKVGDEYDE